MKRTRKSGLSRRHFLAGLGGTTLALPWLEKLDGVAHAQSQSGPKRVLVMSYEMGVPGGAWIPSGTGSNFTLPYVTAPLESIRDKCLFVSSIDNSVLDSGGNSFVFGHPGKRQACLTGTLSTSAFGSSNNNHMSELLSGAAATIGAPANGPSVEQVVGQRLRNGHSRPSVDLGINGESYKYGGSNTMGSNFFFEGAGNPVTLTQNPSVAFNSLFGGLNVDTSAAPSAEQVAQQRAQARNKSVLDAVRSSFTELKQGLGRTDQQRLQDHADRIRQLELDIEVTVGGTCSVPTGISNAASLQGIGMNELAPMHNAILAHALACDIAPVGRIEYQTMQNPYFGIPALDAVLAQSPSTYDWHSMVHGDPLPGTSTYLRPLRDDTTTTYNSLLMDGYRFYVQQFADLVNLLDSIPEGPDQTVLDNTLCVLASDLGEGGGHAHFKMGFVLAGNLGGARTGYHFHAGPANRPFEPNNNYFYDPSRYNVNQLLNSILDMAGLGGQEMGLGGFLESRGDSRRIDGLFA